MPKAAKKLRSKYVCQGCGHVEAKWMGKCPGCNEWNTLVEELPAAAPKLGGSLPGAGAAPVSVSEVAQGDDAPRLATDLGEFDRVLGGGLVPGSLVLLGGDPGVGKSTLLLQGLAHFVYDGAPALYVSGEESVAQTSLRARRLGLQDAAMLLVSETSLERILKLTTEHRPAALIVDSIQTVHTSMIESIPGSISQVRECAAKLMTFAKTSGIPVIVVGHVTKDGALAGPKTLEHVVDTVLHFEGEGGMPYRLLRALKNRFGSTSEVGVFEMRHGGLAEVPNPSALFLAERPLGVPGSVVVASADGSRPLLVEMQALVATPAANFPRRTAAGVDGNRLSLLMAVLAERAGLHVLDQDIFVNVAGGLKLAEPAADLGVICAVASSFRKQAVAADTLVFGEVGLAGEVRGVSLSDLRLAEASKLGFRRVVMPEQNRKRVDSDYDMDLVGVKMVTEALDALADAH